MPHIVFVVDEWADVKLEPKLGKEAEELLINIASRFRAVGIHPIVCTQTPNKDVISIRVKNVLPARLAFACPNIHASMLIVGNGRANGLEPQGRAIFDWGQMQLEIQTPLINNATVDETVASAIRGQFDDVEIAAHDVTDQEIYTWAINENDGKLQSREVWGKFRLRGMSKEYAEKFTKDADGQTVIVGATAYKVVPGNRRQARRLLPVADDPETPPEAPAAE
jgi:DNA segregation ATPase FtsK/SpoIIIE-like protein